ncbi:hypothetical protein FQR65_LT18983 [Abscondita terminalis]|nr:hypothetical protein FQR65_LT18983 [Abscondita terminalis]
MLLAAVILILIAFATRGSYKKSQVPSGIARFIEPLIIFVRDEIALQNIGSVKYKRFVPYLVTLFLFIWLMNILGLLPGSANVTGNIAFTMKNFYWFYIFDPLGNNMPWAGKVISICNPCSCRDLGRTHCNPEFSIINLHYAVLRCSSGISSTNIVHQRTGSISSSITGYILHVKQHCLSVVSQQSELRLAVLGVGLGIGKIGGHAMDAIARQTEQSGENQYCQ